MRAIQSMYGNHWHFASYPKGLAIVMQTDQEMWRFALLKGTNPRKAEKNTEVYPFKKKSCPYVILLGVFKSLSITLFYFIGVSNSPKISPPPA